MTFWWGCSNKKCIKCGVFYPINFFFKTNNNRCGHISYCDFCRLEYAKDYKRSKRGVIAVIYNSQIRSSSKRGHNPPEYSLDELFCYACEIEQFHVLHENWVASGYKHLLKPSIDRIDDYKPYNFDNIRIVTWDENRKKSHYDQIKGKNTKTSKAVVGVSIKDGVAKYFHSIMDAERNTGSGHGAIVACCKNKKHYLSSNGFKWYYYENYVSQHGCDTIIF